MQNPMEKLNLKPLGFNHMRVPENWKLRTQTPRCQSSLHEDPINATTEEDLEFIEGADLQRAEAARLT